MVAVSRPDAGGMLALTPVRSELPWYSGQSALVASVVGALDDGVGLGEVLLELTTDEAETPGF